MKNSCNFDKIWIARVHVKTRHTFEHLLNGNFGAYVNIIAKADNRSKLKFLAKKIFFEEGFVVIEFIDEDMELLYDRLKKFDVDQDILDLVENINETYPVQFGVFHTYPKEDS